MIATKPGMYRGKPAGGGGGALLTSLFDWWEDGDLAGKHASTGSAIYDSSVATTDLPPTGLDYIAGTTLGASRWLTSTFASPISTDWGTMSAIRSNDHSYTKMLGDGRNGIFGMSYVPYGDPNRYILDPSGVVRDLNIVTEFDPKPDGGPNPWYVIALSHNATTGVFTGRIVGPNGTSFSWTGGATVYSLPYTNFFARQQDAAIGAVYSRELTQADAEEFYNSGSFKTYANL